MLEVGDLLEGIADGSIRRQLERSYNKPVYYPRMSRGIVFGTFAERPEIAAEATRDKYGKYTAHRKVTGGVLKVSDEVRAMIA